MQTQHRRWIAWALAGVLVISSGTALAQGAVAPEYRWLTFAVFAAIISLTMYVTYLAAKLVVKIEKIGIVNILAGRDVVRELVQAELTPTSLAEEMVSLLTDDARRAHLQAELADVVAQLGAPGSYNRAAQAVLEVVG